MSFLKPGVQRKLSQPPEVQPPSKTAPTFFLVLTAYLQLLVFDIYLARKTFAGIYDRVRGYPTGKASTATTLDQICEAVDRACVWYWKQVLCLERSVVTACLLKRYGIAAKMVIGAQQVPFKAHAWVEVDAQVVSDDADMRELYQVIDCC